MPIADNVPIKVAMTVATTATIKVVFTAEIISGFKKVLYTNYL